jgi:hypothetical protein
MGWRDVQAGVASGDISFKPEEDAFGSFMSGALGGAIKKRDKEREDAIVAEKERKEKEKLTLQAKADKEILDKKHNSQANYVMEEVGFSGGKDSAEYIRIREALSGGTTQAMIFAGYEKRIKNLQGEVVDGKWINLKSLTATLPELPDLSKLTTAEIDVLLVAANKEGTPRLVNHLTTGRGTIAQQETDAAAAKATTDSAEYAASLGDMDLDRLEVEMEAALKKGDTVRQGQIQTAMDVRQRQLVKKTKAATDQKAADALPILKKVTSKNYIAGMAAAIKGGDPVLAEEIKTVGEAQVADAAKQKGVTINAGAKTFIVAYVDAKTGETLTTNATGDSNGKLYSHTLGRLVEQAPGTNLVDVEAENDNYERVLKLQPMIEPLEKKRKELLATMTSAERLKEIVSENPLVLTTVGSMAAGVNRIGVEMKALVDMSKTASTSSVMEYIDSQAKKSTGLGKIAEAAALYEAEVLKFAYSYAASGLGQSGQGLSNTDFEKALLIVGTGATEKTFLTNLHARVSDSIKATDVVISDFSTSAPVEVLAKISGDLLKGYQQPVSTYATTHGFEEMYKWASKDYVAAADPVATETGGPPTLPKGVMFVDPALVASNPDYWGAFEGKYTKKGADGRPVVYVLSADQESK